MLILHICYRVRYHDGLDDVSNWITKLDISSESADNQLDDYLEKLEQMVNFYVQEMLNWVDDPEDPPSKRIAQIDIISTSIFPAPS